MTTKIHRSRGDVFRDLGLSAEEAAHLKIRSDLMIRLSRLIEDRGLTQARAARLFGVSQPRISDLVRGKIDRFSIDTLMAMLGHAGVHVDVVVRRSSKVASPRLRDAFRFRPATPTARPPPCAPARGARSAASSRRASATRPTPGTRWPKPPTRWGGPESVHQAPEAPGDDPTRREHGCLFQGVGRGHWHRLPDADQLVPARLRGLAAAANDAVGRAQEGSPSPVAEIPRPMNPPRSRPVSEPVPHDVDRSVRRSLMRVDVLARDVRDELLWSEGHQQVEPHRLGEGRAHR
jgi:predicted XRE-type DNA-binding protein